MLLPVVNRVCPLRWKEVTALIPGSACVASFCLLLSLSLPLCRIFGVSSLPYLCMVLFVVHSFRVAFLQPRFLSRVPAPSNTLRFSLHARRSQFGSVEETTCILNDQQILFASERKEVYSKARKWTSSPVFPLHASAAPFSFTVGVEACGTRFFCARSARR